MKQSFESGRENPPGLEQKHSNWAKKQLDDLIASSPLLQDWKEMSRSQKQDSSYFVVGVTMTSIIGSLAFYEPDAKFVAEVSASLAGGVLATDAILRVKRFLQEKLGLAKDSIWKDGDK